MAGWRIKETNNGDVATFHAVVGNVSIDGEVTDCDGDCVTYEVRENATVVAHGEFRRGGDLKTENDCWNAAIAAATKAITINPNPPKPKNKEVFNSNPKPKSFAQPDDDGDNGYRKGRGKSGGKGHGKRRNHDRDHDRYDY